MSDKTAIYQAIPAILAEVEAIAKNRNNQQQGYKFRGIDDVYNAVHPLLAKHKVFPTCEILNHEASERPTKSGGVLFCVVIKAKYTLWASDGSNVVTEAIGEGMDSADKAGNKAMSAAYKYALFQLLCIPTEAVDADAETPEPAPRKAAEPPKADPSAFDSKRFVAALESATDTAAIQKIIAGLDKKPMPLADKNVPYREAFLRLLQLDNADLAWAEMKLTALKQATCLDDVTFTELITKLESRQQPA